MHLCFISTCVTCLPTLKAWLFETIGDMWLKTLLDRHPGWSAASKKTQRQTRVMTLMSFVAPDNTGQGIDHQHVQVTFRWEQLNRARLKPAAMRLFGGCRRLFPFSPKQIKMVAGPGGEGVHMLASQVHQVPIPRQAVLQFSVCPDLWQSPRPYPPRYFLGFWLWTSASRPHASMLCVADWLFVCTSASMSCLIKWLLSFYLTAGSNTSGFRWRNLTELFKVISTNPQNKKRKN